MTPYTVQLREGPRIPLAVIRRRAAATDLPKLVPECCGLVWSAVKAQNTKAGRHVAVYLNDDIDVEVGVDVESPGDADVEVPDVAGHVDLAAVQIGG